MAILPIIETPDPLLRQKSTPVEAVTDETRRLIDDMFETMYAAPGIGLAAIQIGVPKRVLVIGNMHGDEQAGLEVIERLKTRTVPANVGLWLIPSINPDGNRARTRTKRSEEQKSEIKSTEAI